MEIFDPDSGVGPLDSETGSFERPDEADLAGGGFDIGIVDGQEVDIDGDGVPDGVAEVSFADLDGDGVNDYAQVTITADTDGDGVDDTVIIMDQYDTDGDGLADHVDMTYGLDTDGDGKIDTSEFSSGTISNTATDTNGDGRIDTMVQTVAWHSDPVTDGVPASPEPTGAESTDGNAGDVVDSTTDPYVITASIEAELFDLEQAGVEADPPPDLDNSVVETAQGTFVLVPESNADDLIATPGLSLTPPHAVESAFVDPATGAWVEQSPDPA